MKKIFIGTAILLILFTGVFLLFIAPPRTDYYTQIDNQKYEENHSSGGVVDLTGGMKYLYTLKCYASDGTEKDITFGANRLLKDDAYLKLEYAFTRGVLNRSEVKWDELPHSVQVKFQCNSEREESGST